MKNASRKTLQLGLTAVSALLVIVIVVQCLFWSGVIPRGTGIKADESGRFSAVGSLSHEGYELEQTLVLSRHNIRSPFSGEGSVLGSITPYEWFAWSSNPGETSLKGGVLETEMGQYFRKWLEAEKLFPENYDPKEGEVRIYANAKQRTLSSTEYFAAGLLPRANTSVETHAEYDKMDPVFNPQLTFVSPEYTAAAEDQIWKLYRDTVKGLDDNYKLLADVIDLEKSPARTEGSVGAFRTDDTELSLKLNEEPSMKGSLKTGCSVSDALVLQYFEEEDPVKAAFGHSLTEDQWLKISEIKDVYGDVLFSAPLIAANVANPLLREMESELKTEERAFTFLCGHDSNITSVLAALGAEDYTLPGAIEKTPIGCKLVFNRWRGRDGKKYISLDMVYETVAQLRGMPLLDLSCHPAVVPLHFSGLKVLENGMYDETAFMGRLRDAIKEYDKIKTDYGPVTQSTVAGDKYAYTEYPLERNGVKLHLDKMTLEGADPEKNILLVHGVTYSSHEFDIDYEDYSLVRWLAREGYGVWRLDIAGFGRSGEVKDGFMPDSEYASEDINAAVERIVKETGQEKIDVLGWSWGTVTTSLFAGKHPEHLNKLILYAPILSGLGDVEVNEAFHHNTWEHAADDFVKKADGSFDLSIADPDLIEMFCSSCWHYDGDKSPNGGRRDLCVSKDKVLIDLKKITVPTLVICGDSDPYLNYDLVNKAKDSLPEGSDLVMIKGGSHVVYIEKPYYKEFREGLLSFL